MIASLKNFVKTLDDKTRVGKIGMREDYEQLISL